MKRAPALAAALALALTACGSPFPDYGPLIPFGGNAVANEWGYGGYALEGLMTLEGKVAVDPVYEEAGEFQKRSGTDPGPGPHLLLHRPQRQDPLRLPGHLPELLLGR